VYVPGSYPLLSAEHRDLLTRASTIRCFVPSSGQVVTKPQGAKLRSLAGRDPTSHE